jgi:hypothetical protein
MSTQLKYEGQPWLRYKGEWFYGYPIQNRVALFTTPPLNLNKRSWREGITSHPPPLMLNVTHMVKEPPQNTISPIPTWFHNLAKVAFGWSLKERATEVHCI